MNNAFRKLYLMWLERDIKTIELQNENMELLRQLESMKRKRESQGKKVAQAYWELRKEVERLRK